MSRRRPTRSRRLTVHDIALGYKAPPRLPWSPLSLPEEAAAQEALAAAARGETIGSGTRALGQVCVQTPIRGTRL